MRAIANRRERPRVGAADARGSTCTFIEMLMRDGASKTSDVSFTQRGTLLPANVNHHACVHVRLFSQDCAWLFDAAGTLLPTNVNQREPPRVLALRLRCSIHHVLVRRARCGPMRTTSCDVSRWNIIWSALFPISRHDYMWSDDCNHNVNDDANYNVNDDDDAATLYLASFQWR